MAWVSKSRLLGPRRPSIEVFKSLRSPVVVNRKQVGVRVRVHIRSGSIGGLVFKIIVVLGMYLYECFVDLDCLGLDVAGEGHSWVSNKAIIP